MATMRVQSKVDPKYSYEFFVGNQQFSLEDMREKYGNRIRERLGQKEQEHFNFHPEEYVTVCRNHDARMAANATTAT